MKSSVNCPQCGGEHISVSRRSIHLLFSLGISVIGLGLLIPALSKTVGYYLFAFPLCLSGLIAAYKGIDSSMVSGHCMDCDYRFNLTPAEHNI